MQKKPHKSFCATSYILKAGSLIVIDFVFKRVEAIYLETHKLDQNWADLAVAFVCWDMIMNQWSKVFHFYRITLHGPNIPWWKVTCFQHPVIS